MSGVPEGSVPAETVAAVLTAVGVSAIIADGFLISIKDENAKSTKIVNGVINRRGLQWYAVKYGARIEWFYHPELITPGPPTRQ